eukprot:1294018-Rhodomonas_salina.1
MQTASFEELPSEVRDSMRPQPESGLTELTHPDSPPSTEVLDDPRVELWGGSNDFTDEVEADKGAVIVPWHEIVHINTCYLRQIAPDIKGMEQLAKLPKHLKLPVCEVCERAKSKHKPLLKKKLRRYKEKLHLLHTDMSGHIRQPTIDGAHYFLLFLEDSTAY